MTENNEIDGEQPSGSHVENEQNSTPKEKPAFRAVATPRQCAFLAAYSETANITAAAEAAGIGRTTHYMWLEEPEYAANFKEEREAAIDRLELEAVRRARDGVERLKFNNGKPVIDPRTGEPYVEREYSDRLLIFLLKAARPEKYSERHENKISGEVTNHGGGNNVRFYMPDNGRDPNAIHIHIDDDWYGNKDRLDDNENTQENTNSETEKEPTQ